MKKIFLSVLFIFLSLNAFGTTKPNSAEVLSVTMCNQLYVCDSTLTLDRDLCINEALSGDQLLDEFGGPEMDGTGKSFGGVRKLISAGIISLDITNLLSCVSSIQSLSCSSSNIKSAWSARTPTHFSNLEELVDGLTDCEAVFY